MAHEMHAYTGAPQLRHLQSETDTPSACSYLVAAVPRQNSEWTLLNPTTPPQAHPRFPSPFPSTWSLLSCVSIVSKMTCAFCPLSCDHSKRKVLCPLSCDHSKRKVLCPLSCDHSKRKALCALFCDHSKIKVFSNYLKAPLDQ